MVSNNFFNEAAKALKQGQTVKLLIGGHSMYPFIRGGIDLVEVVPFSFEEELPAWCCPFYQWNGKYLIHRYIGKKGNEYMMLGDGNLARIERVKREDIIGILRTMTAIIITAAIIDTAIMIFSLREDFFFFILGFLLTVSDMRFLLVFLLFFAIIFLLILLVH